MKDLVPALIDINTELLTYSDLVNSSGGVYDYEEICCRSHELVQDTLGNIVLSTVDIEVRSLLLDIIDNYMTIVS